VKKSCVAAYPVGWPDGRGISGRMRVEWVAGSPWNRWSDAHGMGGQMTVESADTATLDGIRVAERQFAMPGQLERLQRYHAEKADWVLRAWIDTWLSDAFNYWNLDGQLAKVECPLLALHGDHDEYGSRLHPERICALTSGPSELQILRDCGHVPHREHPETVLAAITRFLARSNSTVFTR